MSRRLAIGMLACASAVPAAGQDEGSVSALGRLAPKDGVRRIGVSSTPESITLSVLEKLLVDEGDDVEAGQLLAVTDSASVLEARVAQLVTEAILAERGAEASGSRADEACVRSDVAARVAERLSRLREQGIASEDETERAEGDAQAQAAACVAARSDAELATANVDAARARVTLARAELSRTQVRAPISGRVLDVIARPGEFIGPEGVLELGDVSAMYAIAEVYETDIGRVRVGQAARVTSPALPGPLTGRVDRIRHKVQKQDALGTDPAARKDARIVEVEIVLDSPETVASLTHLQVEILIGP